MGILNWFKKDKPHNEEEMKEENEGNVLLAMPLFEKGSKYNIEAVVKHLKEAWGYEIKGSDYNDTTAVLTIDGTLFAIAFIPAAVPQEDMAYSAQFAYNWKSVLEDTSEVDGHALVSVLKGSLDIVARQVLLSRILYSIIATSTCIGVYQGSQTLLIPREQYLAAYEELKLGKVVVPLWIYIGLRTTEEGNSIYTYGLKAFDKQELEVINSPLELEELYSFFINICSYVIGSNIVFKHGETLGYTAEQKIQITASKGVFLEGETLKLEI